MKHIKLFEQFNDSMYESLTSAKFIGMDDWSRDLYKGNDNKTYVDVDGELHTMTKDGEPSYPVKKLNDLTIVDSRNIKSNATLESLKKAIIEYEKGKSDPEILERALELLEEIKKNDPMELEKWVKEGKTLKLQELLRKTSYLGNGNSPEQLRDFNAFSTIDTVGMHHRNEEKIK